MNFYANVVSCRAKYVQATSTVYRIDKSNVGASGVTSTMAGPMDVSMSTIMIKSSAHTCKDVGVSQIARVVPGEEDVRLSGNICWNLNHNDAVGSTLWGDWNDLETADEVGKVSALWDAGGLKSDQST